MRVRWAIAIVVSVAWMAAVGQQASDPEAILRRTRERLLDDLSRLPRYTCVQTITRRYFEAPSTRSHSCGELIAAHDQRKSELTTRAWDRLRLEVAIVDGNNVFSWVEASEFGENNIEELAGRGPLGSGDFGSFLDSVFRYARIRFEREDVFAGRRMLAYAYEMPLEKSGYLVRAGSSWVTTSYVGTFLLDPDAVDIVKMTVRTAELPEPNPGCQANSDIQYQRTSIHDRMILIPQETHLNAIDRDGSESLSVTTYERCREFASKSRMLLSAPRESAAGPAPRAAAISPLSSGIRFGCRIITPLDSNTAAAGDPVEAVLRSPIHDKKRNILIPAGAHLRGRLIQMEHRSGTFESFRLAVQWESITAGGREIPLRAEPDVYNRIGQVLVLPNDQSPRAIVFHKDHLRLQQFDWNWTTVAAEAGKDAATTPPAAGRAVALPHTVEISDSEFPIAAASGVDFKFSVPAGAFDVRVEGTFSAAGGSLDDLEVLLFTSDEFQHWRNQEPATTLYKSGENTNGVLNIAVPSVTGTYHLVFSNNFLLSTPKVVQASLRLHYNLSPQQH
jgi:hypothetical protein